MIPDDKSPSPWLGLNEAARQLGVHPATLRRWADDGAIPVMITPGGHRRFAAAQLDRFSEERQRLRVVAGIEQGWADQVLDETRRQISAQHDAAWLSSFDEQQREHKRILGRHLLNITLRYISLKEGGEDWLESARAIGREHAEDGLRMGLSLAEALKIVLFFRDTLFTVTLRLPEVAHVKAEVNARLLQRIGILLAAVELAVAETYDQAYRLSTSQLSISEN
ncbi:MAG TPA: helix-turn-helix domain-containing protein [Anaerolineae bacterium]|nr:helix-turn-helix domain-containing protein [Anaerolineae bacterium]